MLFRWFISKGTSRKIGDLSLITPTYHSHDPSFQWTLWKKDSYQNNILCISPSSKDKPKLKSRKGVGTTERKTFTILKLWVFSFGIFLYISLFRGLGEWGRGDRDIHWSIRIVVKDLIRRWQKKNVFIHKTHTGKEEKYVIHCTIFIH